MIATGIQKCKQDVLALGKFPRTNQSICFAKPLFGLTKHHIQPERYATGDINFSPKIIKILDKE
jgi:hypothetical protein